jgi:hypothetical protein
MRSCLVALSVLGAIPCSASESTLPPPDSWPGDIGIKTTSTREPVQSIRIGDKFARLEISTFDDIAHALGPAPLFTRGDAAGFEMWICYTLPLLHARVWFTSSELGGRKYINGASLLAIDAGEIAHENCPTPVSPVPKLTTDRGMRLGMPMSDAVRLLGKPIFIGPNIAYWASLNSTAKLDVSSTLLVRIEKGEVVQITADHTSTT